MHFKKTIGAWAVMAARCSTATSPTAHRGATHCLSNVCVSMNIPSSTAESGIGPVFYLVTAPAEFSDIEVGIGFDGDDGDEGNDWDHTRSRPKEVSSGDKSIEPSALVVIETHNIFGEQFVSIELDTARPAPEIGAEMGRRPAHGRYGPEQRPVVIPLDGTGVRDNMVVGDNCYTRSPHLLISQPGSRSSSAVVSLSRGRRHGQLPFRKRDDGEEDDFKIHRRGTDVHRFRLNTADATGGSSTNPFLDRAENVKLQQFRESMSPVPDRSLTDPASRAALTGEALLRGWAGRLRKRVRAQLPFGNNVNIPGSVTAAKDKGSAAAKAAAAQAAKLAKLSLIRRIHGITGSLACAVFFPAGGILIRTGHFRGTAWVHAGIQIVGWMMLVATFGMGLFMADILGLIRRTHPILGIVTTGLLFFQPIIGFVHHVGYRKSLARTPASYLHIWLGRAGILVGLVTGGLGFQLARSIGKGGMRPNDREVLAYGIVAGVMGLAYIASAIWDEIRRVRARRQRKVGNLTASYY